MVIFILVLPWSQTQARRSYPVYFLERPTITAVLSHELESEKRTGSFINSEHDTSTTSEKFEIDTDGWVYHPALLIFSVGLKPEFKQQKVSSNTTFTDENDFTFFGYSVDTTFLQYKPYTVNLYASKDRSDFSSSLAADSSTESSTYKGQLLLKYQPVPTTISVESKEQITESFFLTSNTSDKLRVESKHKTSRSKTTFEAEVLEQNRSIRGIGFSGKRKLMRVHNQYKTGEKSSLSTGFGFSDNTSGVVDSASSYLFSQLSIRHRENLDTSYQLRVENREEQDFESKKIFGVADLTHQLYENLTTILSANVDKNKLTGGNLDTYSAGLDFRYVRRIPWGNLNINLGHREQIEDNQRQVATAEVRDESHVLTGTVLETLAKSAIAPGSIKVTDNTETTTYVENVDYTVSPIGNTVQIARTLFGGITDGQEVWVDYSFEPDPPAKTATISDTFGINLDLWSILRLYYQRGHSEEKLLSGIEPSELTDDTVQRTGAVLRWRWSTTRAEVEDRNTTRTPTKTFRFTEALAFRIEDNLSFGFNADFHKREFKDTGEQSQGSGFSANFRWNLGRYGQLSTVAFNQRVRGVAQSSIKKGLNALYQWKYGAWRPSIKYEYANEVDQLANESRKRNNILFTIERKFR